jgi:hypothetical protein|tara:strand:+ start:6884 stop:7579 length:696 start_codon:yes stop_codon:yes gene_type:complete
MGSPTSNNKVNDRLNRNVDANNDGVITEQEARAFNNQANPTDTAKNNYTGVRYGNDHGSCSFGHIHKPGDVTAGILLQAKDGRHSFFMDNDGQRKGWTSAVAPGNYQVTCGEDNEEAQDSMFFHASNGNIVVLATNGKLRLQATDIELVAVGEGGSKGNIKMVATENISLDSKKLLVTTKNLYKIVSTGSAELVANSQMKIYSSVIRGVSDGCAIKDSKNNLQKIQRENQG